MLIFSQACKQSSNKNLVTGNHDTVLQFKSGNVSYEDSLKLNEISEKWYDAVLKRSKFNGGMIVAKNDKIIFEKYNGCINPKGTDSITSTTPFHIASVSKTFTAMGVLKLWQEKKLDIDKPVSEYLDSFNYPGVTVRSLLNHRSGLPNYIYFMEKEGWDKHIYAKNKDVLNYLIHKKDELKNIGRPNASFNYCNTNYVLLALIIEKVSGITYPEYIKKTFFDPIGMKNSFVFTINDTSKITYSYDWRRNLIPLDFLDVTYGDKNIYSTPEDILRWDMALKSHLIFNDSILEQEYSPYSNEKAGIRNYGLGWRMNIFPDGKKTIYHNGWWHGNNAVYLRVPHDGITIIVLGNVFNRLIYKAHEMLTDIDGKLSKSESEELKSEGGEK
ncbi:MAG: serine hydrolase domain-containing protein [Ferruginibacter sp.]